VYVPGSTAYRIPTTNKIPNGFVPNDDLANDARLVDDRDAPIPIDGVTDANAVLLPPGTGQGGTGDDHGTPDPKDYVYRDVEPQAVTKVLPQYPQIAKDAGMEGSVTVRLLVGIDGRVQKAEIEQSSAMFDDAALAAGRQWIFTPALANDHPVRVWVRVPMKFQLR
jgi:protein TonB